MHKEMQLDNAATIWLNLHYTTTCTSQPQKNKEQVRPSVTWTYEILLTKPLTLP